MAAPRIEQGTALQSRGSQVVGMRLVHSGKASFVVGGNSILTTHHSVKRLVFILRVREERDPSLSSSLEGYLSSREALRSSRQAVTLQQC
jgi:hypothetical protein